MNSGLETDLVFVLVFGSLFLTFSAMFYYCDQTYRNNFYFEGYCGGGNDEQTAARVLDNTCRSSDIVLMMM